MPRAQKILFTEFAELAQGDGKGPKYYPGKAYWLPADHAARWKSEGIAEDAPAAMTAENEPSDSLAPSDVRIVRVGDGLFDVVGPQGMKFNVSPASAHDAEKLRQLFLERPQGPYGLRGVPAWDGVDVVKATPKSEPAKVKPPGEAKPEVKPEIKPEPKAASAAVQGGYVPPGGGGGERPAAPTSGSGVKKS